MLQLLNLQKRRVLFLKFIFMLSFFCASVFSADLKAHYSISAQELNASVIFPQIKDDFLIYQFDENRHIKSFSSSVLIKSFQEHNISLDDKSQGIVHFNRNTQTDLGPIKEKVREYYLSYYPSMQISSIDFHLNNFIESLPEEYEIIFKTNAHQYRKSTLQLSALKSKKRYFISYHIHAKVKLFKASHNINRGKILSPIDLTYTNEPFRRLKGIPLKTLDETEIRIKKRLREGSILYEHDIERVPSVLKDEDVYVRLINGNVQLEFQAKSLQDGNIGDMISIQKSDNQRLKAKVVGKNLVEVE